MPSFPKLLIAAGCLLILVGVGWHFGSKLGLGRLPGDIAIQKENVRFYFPITTSILVSIVLSLIAYVIRYFR
jgi:hypothetical protein